MTSPTSVGILTAAIREASKILSESAYSTMAGVQARRRLDAALNSLPLKMDESIARGLPDGTVDYATHEAIEDALDRADAPLQIDGKWLTLAQRVDALAAAARTGLASTPRLWLVEYLLTSGDRTWSAFENELLARREMATIGFMTTRQRLLPLHVGFSPAATGWVIADGQEARYRTMNLGMVEWTDQLSASLFFARRCDAETFAAEDDDAWMVIERPLPVEGAV